RRRSRCVAVLGAAALVAGGCGGGDDSAAGTSLTKAQFITRAAAVCRDVKKAHQPYAEQVDKLAPNVDLKRVAPLLQGTLAESRKGLARLRALTPPPADRAAIDAYYRAAEALLEAHSRLADAARTNDRATGEKVAAAVGGLSDDERRLATRYGLKDCDNVF
ncbi:MAG: hypothetical protein QOG42_1303, partial [Solirubrobacteraceae bacterium]|nr:hypothetical protein [Solirubrobacteraceae bacterium]